VRVRFVAILVVPLIIAASAPAQPQLPPLDQQLRQARTEQASAEAETARLEAIAAKARSEAERLQAEQAAAAQAIEAAEARITAADAQLRLASAYVAAHRERLSQEQEPVSALLGGLAVMARRPPLLAVVDGGGVDELVKVETLLDSTIPLIRARTRSLSAELKGGQRLEAAALAARTELDRSRQALAGRRRQLAELEQRSYEQSLTMGGKALGTSDAAIAAAEQVQRLQGEKSSDRSARALAALLASEGPAPPRPTSAVGPRPAPPFAYVLPVSAPVIDGLGAVDDSGVRSRGVTFATPRAAPVIAPADGTVRFSGPFRGYDGVFILDHGNGWMTMIVNMSSPLNPGTEVRLGEPLGRTLGPIHVELSHNGQRFSAALIAGSSRTLSKAMKGG
jgi:septal ring factor EnvC (AmiA/AmiB activator)